jgi:hypothetical protein
LIQVMILEAGAKIKANRAACYIKLLQWGLAEADCRTVLETEPDNAKVNCRLCVCVAPARVCICVCVCVCVCVCE